jgi:hypothetical protein
MTRPLTASLAAAAAAGARAAKQPAASTPRSRAAAAFVAWPSIAASGATDRIT